MADYRALTYHGGALEVARRLAPNAPKPWIDLSTGINPHAYPLPDLGPEAWSRLPESAPLAKLEAAAALRYGVGVHRAGNVLNLLLAEIGEAYRQIGTDLFPQRTGTADPARRGQRLQSGGNIDAVAEQVAVLDDDVAQMQADAELHLFELGSGGVRLGDRRLHRQRAGQRVDRAGEFRGNAVAGGGEDASAMRRDQACENGAVVRQHPQGADFVASHQAGIASDIRRQDGGEFALDDCAFCHAGFHRSR